MLVALLAALSALVWFIWFGWDTQYSALQVSGAVICGVALAILAPRFLPAGIVIITIPIAFTLACAATIYPQDETGLSLIGITMVGILSLVGVAVVVGFAEIIRSRKNPETVNHEPVAGPA